MQLSPLSSRRGRNEIRGNVAPGKKEERGRGGEGEGDDRHEDDDEERALRAVETIR